MSDSFLLLQASRSPAVTPPPTGDSGLLACEEVLEEGDALPPSAGSIKFTMGPIFTALHDPKNGLPRERPEGFSKTPPPKSKPKNKAPPEGVSALLKAAGRITSVDPPPSPSDPINVLQMLAAGRGRPSAPWGERNAADADADTVSETETASDQPPPAPPAPPAPPRVLNMFFAKDKLRAAQAVAAANRKLRTENTD